MRHLRYALLGLLALAALVLGAGPAAAAPGATERVSVASDGTEANAGSGLQMAISGDGRFVAFSSIASNLVPGDTNMCTILGFPTSCRDVFVHDRQTDMTERVSVDSAGVQGNGHSGSTGVWISGDGRFVAFSSDASNLVAGDTNGFDVLPPNQGTDVFVHDRQAGSTERVSVSSAGLQGNGDSATHSYSVSISSDGQFVAFNSSATNLAPLVGDLGFPVLSHIYVHDRQTGTTELASVTSDGQQGDATSEKPAISGDGRFVAFTSSADNLVPIDNPFFFCVYVFIYDRQTGTTEMANVSSTGIQGLPCQVPCGCPSLSADGRFVAFVDIASNLVAGDTNGFDDIFVHDRQTGTTERVSVTSDGSEANSSSSLPDISGDGRFVTFISRASNLVAGDTNNARDVFVHDRQTGTTTRVNVHSAGRQAFGGGVIVNTAISAAGRFVAFDSDATNLVGEDTDGDGRCDTGCDDNFARDVFVRDLGDSDGDGEWDPFDPCPGIPDCDNDGWSDGAEAIIGTDPLDDCSDGPTDHANPADIDNDTDFTSADMSLVASVIGQAVPPARRDIAPATPDGFFTSADMSEVAARIGQSCTP